MVPIDKEPEEKITLGWREWVSLPEVGIPMLKAKVDTGARTSALHAFEVRSFEEDGIEKVAFKLHPKQKDRTAVLECVADIIDQRTVTDSGGHKEKRWVIKTPLHLGEHVWPIEITLTARDDMRFRMLLGRTALNGRAWVDPELSYVVGERPTKSRNGP